MSDKTKTQFSSVLLLTIDESKVHPMPIFVKWVAHISVALSLGQIVVPAQNEAGHPVPYTDPSRAIPTMLALTASGTRSLTR